MLLSIHTTPAQIDIRTYPGSFNLKIRNAELEVRQKPPLIRIKTEQPVVLIDQYQCFAESGLKSNTDLMREQGQKGMQSIYNYTGKVAQDGDAMSGIGHKANIMIDIIKRDSFKMHEFGLGTMPKSRPKMKLSGGTLDLEAEFRNNVGEINGVSCKYAPGDVGGDYTPAKVDIRMVSYGSVDIKYLGNNVDGYI